MGKGLFLLILASMLSLDITMLSMAAYQNVDDVCDGFNLDRDQIALVRLLGTGNFGQVSKAIYGASHSEVAVKSLKGSYMHFAFLQLMVEFRIISHKSNFLFQLSAINGITRSILNTPANTYCLHWWHSVEV